MFLNVYLWRRSLCSNLGGIGLEKLYRATLTMLSWATPNLHKILGEYTVLLAFLTMNLHGYSRLEFTVLY